MSPTPSSPVGKRPYQASIAAFFPSSHIAGLPIRTKPSSTFDDDSLQQRQPPAHVQSSLLNVGMRVRKAISGGYRKPKTLEVHYPNSTDGPGSVTPIASVLSAKRNRELQPFACDIFDDANALHQVGGMAGGPVAFNQYSTAMNRNPQLDQENHFPSSQESNSSTDSMPASRGKRGFEDIEDEEDTEEATELEDRHARDAFHIMMQQTICTRPRARLQRRRPLKRSTSTMPAIVVPDFDEATFLQPMDDSMDLS